MSNSKAWGKSPVAIEQQALLGLVTHLLKRLFLHKKGLKLPEPHSQAGSLRTKQTQVTLIMRQAFERLRQCFLLYHSTYQVFHCM